MPTSLTCFIAKLLETCTQISCSAFRADFVGDKGVTRISQDMQLKPLIRMKLAKIMHHNFSLEVKENKKDFKYTRL